MNSFGFEKNENKYSFVWEKISAFFSRANFLFLFFVLFCFFSFGFVRHTMDVLLSDDKVLALDQNIDNIALYTWALDDDFSEFLYSYRDLRETYKSKENIFEHNLDDIYYMIGFIKTRQDYLRNIIPKDYEFFFNFMVESLIYLDDIKYLFWNNSKKRFLVVLQNNWENRPNWGFFWSYAILEIKNWHIQDIEIKDVYGFHNKHPDLRFSLPSWSHDMFSARDSRLVSSNMFGFSDMDGENIMELYNSSSFESIDGVVFTQSEMFTDIIEWFEKFLYRRQFINTSINLIRWVDNAPNHKEIYLSEVSDFVYWREMDFVKNTVKKFDKISSNNYINIYIPDLSNEFKNILGEYSFTNEYAPEKIYVFEKNTAYNKVDRFVSKYVELYQDSELVSENNDNKHTVYTDELNGVYNLDLYYNLNVPESYFQYMYDMEEKYDIELDEREKHILWLELIWRNEVYVYLPKDIDVKYVDLGYGFEDYIIIDSPFSKIIKLDVELAENNRSAYIQVWIEME